MLWLIFLYFFPSIS